MSPNTETTTVPFLDMARRTRRFAAAGHAAIDRITDRGVVLLGPETEAFETALAHYTGYKHAIAIASATEALRLTMSAMHIGPGDEVIVPAFTAVPTAAAVCASGATPVFVDVDPETATMNISAAAARVTERTRAVIPVHLYGRPSEIPDLGVPVIEDAAQADGALVHHHHSAAVSYSFYPTKNLGGLGDGGAIVTDDDDLALRMRRMRVHGLTENYVHTEISTNARLSEFEAAWLAASLLELDTDNERRRMIARRYREAAPHLQWQADHERHVYHLCVVRVPDRDAWRARAPFGTALHYPVALTQQPAYEWYVDEPCREAEGWAAECVSLPCFPEMTDEEVAFVAEALSCL
ncbi:MAG: DegT/DnrJ/EryC1/StrS family aminotransferase [Acidimicrobiia bacterium]